VIMPAERVSERFSGVHTALVTPFLDGEIDWPALDRLVERQVESGVDGVVPCGTTGESATLSQSEHGRIVETVVKRVAGRCKVLAGAGSNCTRTAVELARHAAAVGADGVLVVTPYYNRPEQAGLFEHYSAVAQAVNLPIVLYNVPARCGVDLANETVMRLRDRYKHVVALKDASGGVDRIDELLSRSDIGVICGDDRLTLPLMAMGAIGVISVLSNLVPKRMKALVDTVDRDPVAARRLHHRICTLATELGSCGSNPVPIKTAMAMQGLLSEEFRLPLCRVGPVVRTRIDEILRKHEVGGSQGGRH